MLLVTIVGNDDTQDNIDDTEGVMIGMTMMGITKLRNHDHNGDCGDDAKCTGACDDA